MKETEFNKNYVIFPQAETHQDAFNYFRNCFQFESQCYVCFIQTLFSVPKYRYYFTAERMAHWGENKSATWG